MASKCLWPELPVQVSQPINAFIAPPIPPNCSQISKKDHDYLLVTFSWIFEETSINVYIFNSHQWLNSPLTKYPILPCGSKYCHAWQIMFYENLRGGHDYEKYEMIIRTEEKNIFCYKNKPDKRACKIVLCPLLPPPRQYCQSWRKYCKHFAKVLQNHCKKLHNLCKKNCIIFKGWAMLSIKCWHGYFRY